MPKLRRVARRPRARSLRAKLGGWLIILFLGWLLPRLAQAQSTPEDAVYGLLAVGLPVADGVVFVGGVTSALSGTIALREGRESPGWRVANLSFAGLNAGSTLGYAVAMSAVRGIWPYLLWPFLAHTGLSIANLVIGIKLGRLPKSPPPLAGRLHLQLTPVLQAAPNAPFTVGATATLTLR